VSHRSDTWYELGTLLSVRGSGGDQVTMGSRADQNLYELLTNRDVHRPAVDVKICSVRPAGQEENFMVGRVVAACALVLGIGSFGNAATLTQAAQQVSSAAPAYVAAGQTGGSSTTAHKKTAKRRKHHRKQAKKRARKSSSSTTAKH
jgi:hypothetical protein